MYKIVYTKTSVKDIPKLKAVHLDLRAKALTDLIRSNPFQTPPGVEKLVGDLKGLFFRRINIQHRLVYQVNEEEKIIKIVSMLTRSSNRWKEKNLCKYELVA